MKTVANPPPAEAPQIARPRLRAALRRARPLLLGALGALAVLLLNRALFPAPLPPSAAQINAIALKAMGSATPPPAHGTLAYRAALPAFVGISVERPAGAPGDDSGRFGIGSGVLVNANGMILTSLHVVDDAEAITLLYTDGTSSTATILTREPEHDIAVLAADRLPEKFAPAQLGNPGALRPGDEVFALGNPLGQFASFSAGVVSGLDRTFTPIGGGQEITGMIQIDAAVNPGNSGGPLLNKHGQVVGIVTGLLNPTDKSFFVGIGYAVPINVAGGGAGMPSY